MYAHQVIENLSQYNSSSKRNYLNSLHLVCDMLKAAHCFHLKDVYDVTKSFKINGTKRLFFDDAEFIKFPYPVCWFDFVDKDNADIFPKSGVLTFFNNEENLLYIWIVSFFKDDNRWTLVPVLNIFSLGENFTLDSEILKNKRYTINTPDGVIRNAIVLDLTDDIETVKAFEPFCTRILTIIECVILLLNCQNITTETHEPPPKLNSVRRKKGRHELFTYKTLKLIVPTHQHRDRQFHQSTKNHNRIHFCRGHFKKYTKDAPLFGKLIGLWWWQARVRGQNKDGIVLKDYEIVSNNP